MPEELKLSNSDQVALVDAEDLERLSQYTWYLGSTGNVMAHMDHTTRTLQATALDAPPRAWVGFKDDDRLNCQKANLYYRDHAAAVQSYDKHTLIDAERSSKYKGVTYSASRRRWIARITVDGKVVYLGATHRTDVEAAKAYDRGARKHYGPDAYVNFPKETQTPPVRTAED